MVKFGSRTRATNCISQFALNYFLLAFATRCSHCRALCVVVYCNNNVWLSQNPTAHPDLPHGTPVCRGTPFGNHCYKQLYVYSIALIPAPCFNDVRLLGATAERQRDPLGVEIGRTYQPEALSLLYYCLCCNVIILLTIKFVKTTTTTTIIVPHHNVCPTM